MSQQTSAKDEKQIIVFILYDDQRRKFKFYKNFALKRILEDAIRVFGLSPPKPGGVYQFYYKGTLLPDLNKSLEYYDIKENDELVLIHRHLGA